MGSDTSGEAEDVGTAIVSSWDGRLDSDNPPRSGTVKFSEFRGSNNCGLAALNCRESEPLSFLTLISEAEGVVLRSSICIGTVSDF